MKGKSMLVDIISNIFSKKQKNGRVDINITNLQKRNTNHISAEEMSKRYQSNISYIVVGSKKVKIENLSPDEIAELTQLSKEAQEIQSEIEATYFANIGRSMGKNYDIREHEGFKQASYAMHIKEKEYGTIDDARAELQMFKEAKRNLEYAIVDMDNYLLHHSATNQERYHQIKMQAEARRGKDNPFYFDTPDKSENQASDEFFFGSENSKGEIANSKVSAQDKLFTADHENIEGESDTLPESANKFHQHSTDEIDDISTLFSPVSTDKPDDKHSLDDLYRAFLSFDPSKIKENQALISLADENILQQAENTSVSEDIKEKTVLDTEENKEIRSTNNDIDKREIKTAVSKEIKEPIEATFKEAETENTEDNKDAFNKDTLKQFLSKVKAVANIIITSIKAIILEIIAKYNAKNK